MGIAIQIRLGTETNLERTATGNERWGLPDASGREWE